MGAKVGKPLGQKRAPDYYNDNITGTMRNPGIYIGVVKKNDDDQHMGRLQVWIEQWGGDPEDEESWISVGYASPFAGTTSIFDQGQNYSEYEDTIKSYGWWAVPPDLDTRVLVAFNDGGNVEKGYWFACLYQRNTQISVPGIPSKKTYDGENIPAAPKNKKDPDTDLEKYVTHKPVMQALSIQGLENDPVRGLTSSSAMRESPSRVTGLLTPGQHQFVMDDGDKDGQNRLIRLRTVGGTQILLDDVAGHVYLISKKGKNWIELDADGRIHMYADEDISIHSQANINLYADKNVNIEAGQNINLKANAANIKLEAGNEISSYATTNTKITSGETSNINSQVGHYETAGVIHMNGPVAEAHSVIETYELLVNQGITQSICTVVPEHEPWAGHSGSINPNGLGNQQMQQDPAPGQNPRQPGPNEQAAPVESRIEFPNELQVNLSGATTSAAAQDAIKESNGFSPVIVKDGNGGSAGFGSPIITNDGGEG